MHLFGWDWLYDLVASFYGLKPLTPDPSFLHTRCLSWNDHRCVLLDCGYFWLESVSIIPRQSAFILLNKAATRNLQVWRLHAEAEFDVTAWWSPWGGGGR